MVSHTGAPYRAPALRRPTPGVADQRARRARRPRLGTRPLPRRRTARATPDRRRRAASRSRVTASPAARDIRPSPPRRGFRAPRPTRSRAHRTCARPRRPYIRAAPAGRRSCRPPRTWTSHAHRRGRRPRARRSHGARTPAGRATCTPSRHPRRSVSRSLGHSRATVAERSCSARHRPPARSQAADAACCRTPPTRGLRDRPASLQSARRDRRAEVRDRWNIPGLRPGRRGTATRRCALVVSSPTRSPPPGGCGARARPRLRPWCW